MQIRSLIRDISITLVMWVNKAQCLPTPRSPVPRVHVHGGQEGFSPTAGFRHCHRHCYHSVRFHWTRYTTKNSDTLRMTLNGFSFSSAELFLQMVPLCQWDPREIFHAPKHCVEGTCGRRSVRAEAPTSLRSSDSPRPHTLFSHRSFLKPLTSPCGRVSVL